MPMQQDVGIELLHSLHIILQVPMLEDPNTQSYLWESAAIIRYLQHTYG
jgi:glutathione S-transferase